MSRKRWIKRVLAGLLALGPRPAGASSNCSWSPADYKDAVLNGLPPGLETDPHDADPARASVDRDRRRGRPRSSTRTARPG